MLQRVLQRAFGFGRCGYRGPFKQFVGHSVGVVLPRNCDRVADPEADRELREGQRPLFLARAAKRLKRVVPRFDACGQHDSPEGAMRLATVIQGDQAFLARLSGIKGVLEHAHEFGGYWNGAFFVADMMLGLW